MASGVRIGFIGCGGMATAHIKAIAPMSADDATIVALCDVDAAKAEARAAELKALRPDAASQPDLFPEPTALLTSADVDCVYILLPPFAHGEAERACLAHGKPFFVEKPVGLDMGLTREIADEVETLGLMTCAGYMNRYRAGVRQARAMLQEDTAVLVTGGWIGASPSPKPGDTGTGSWWVQKDRSGGQLVEQVTHTFDLVRYLCGEATEVSAFGATGFNRGVYNYGIEDASVVNIRFERGTVADLFACCAANGGGGGVSLNVYAHDVTLQFSGWDHALKILRERGKQVDEVKGEPDIFAIEDRVFLDAVRTGDPSGIRSTYPDAARTLELTLAANRSMETGHPVRVGERSGPPRPQ